METIVINKDIKVFYVKAASFPAGVEDAYNKLHQLLSFSPGRRYFGVSRPEKEENGNIVYRAAAEELAAGEAEKLNCGTLVLKKGNYISLTVEDYKKNILAIDKAFKILLAYPGIDPDGYCVEWYLTDQEAVKCMVKLE
jgi:hypothetical protein